MILSLPGKRYNIPIISFILLASFFGAHVYASPGKHGHDPARDPVYVAPGGQVHIRTGQRAYFTPACPIVTQNFNTTADVNGATSDPSSVGWYLDASQVPNATYFAAKSHRLKAQNLGGEGVWYSQVFSIASYTGIQVDAKISSEGPLSSSTDYIRVYYKLDGGPETLISAQNGYFGTLMVTSSKMTGSTVQIVIRMADYTTGNAEYYVENYDVFKEKGPCTVSGISVSAAASNSGVLTCTNPSTTLSATTTATGTTTYSWTGPNSFTSTSANPVVSTAGTYTVTGTNSAGTGTASVTVTTNNTAPGATASLPTTNATLTCSNTSVVLTGSSSTSGVSYAWSGPSSFTASTASATATAAGTYTLTVTNPTNGCTSTASTAVTQNITAPAAVAIANPGTLTCTTTSETLTASSSTSGTTFAWTGPNSFNATGATATATAAGTYTVTATNPTTGCTATASTTVTQTTTVPATVTASNNGPLTCTKTSVTLTGASGTSGATFAWTGPSSFTATGATATATAAGTYTVTATNPTTGCTATASTTVAQTITAPASVAIANPGTLTCTTTSLTLTASSSTSGTTFAWTGPSSFTATGATATATAAGTYTVTATNPTTGCTATASTTVTQSITAPASVTATSSGTLTCTTASVTLTGASTTSGTTFAWTGPNGFTATTATATATAAGIYTLKVTNPTNGCFSTVNDTVTQNIATPGAAIAATPANSVLTCTATTISLAGSSSTSGVSYAWTGPSSFTAATATAAATTAGIYTLKVTNPVNGCFSTVKDTVTQNIAAPAALTTSSNPTNATLTCAINNIVLSGSSTTTGVSYNWAGPNNYTASSSVATVFAAGTYTLTATNTANGCVATASVTVLLDQNYPANVAISPNLATLTCSSPTASLTGSSTTSGVNYSWTGPNGYTATGVNATAASSGLYSLSVTSPGNGCSTTTTATISQNFTPPASVIANNDGPLTCSKTVVKLTGSSTTSGATYKWTGPNSFTATGATAAVSTPGSYIFTATNPVNGCTASTTTIVAQNDSVPAGLSISSNPANPVLTCVNSSVTLTANTSSSGVNYSWSGPGGFTSSASSVAIGTAGTYTVTATKTTTGCSSAASTSITQNITVPANVTATTVPTNALLTCSSPTVALTGSSSVTGANYAWTGPNSFTATAATATVSNPGSYTVTATDPSNGCSSTASALITQNIAAPTGMSASSSSGGTVLNCTNPSLVLTGASSTAGVNFSWTGPNGFTTSTTVATASVAGTYTVKATNPVNGCYSTTTVTLSQDTVSPSAVSTSSVPANAILTCTSTAVVFTGSSSTTGVTYGWTGPNNFSVSGAVATATSPGSYVLRVTNPSNGCSSAVTASPVTQNISVPSNITAVVSSVLSCNQPSVTLTANSTTSGVTYLWTGPGNFSAATRIATATLGGNYTLTATNSANGCSIQKPVTIVADTAAPANVTATNNGPLTCSVTSVTLTGNSSTSGVQYQWTGNDDGFFDANQVTSVSVAETYELLVINPNNGCAATVSTTVTQNLTGCSMVAPKATSGTAASLNQAGLTNGNTTATHFEYKAYPNPASNSAFIEFRSPVAGQVSVAIYNNLGILEKMLFNNPAEANQLYKLTISTSEFNRGVHYCIIRTANQSYTSKLLFFPNKP